MGALGHKVFESLTKPSQSDSINGQSEAAEERIVYINKTEASATAKIANEGVVVLAGSTIRQSLVPSCPDVVKRLRAEHNASIDENGVLQKDILFKSPSGASSFVLGASSNGYTDWKSSENETLKSMEVSAL